MSGEIYDAFVEAGASPDKARKAAEAVAHLERDATGRHTELSSFRYDFDQRLLSFRNEVDHRFTKVDGELTLLKWMVGVNTAAVIAVLLKLLFP